MATATKETKKVLIPPIPQVLDYKTVDDGVTLRLNQKEAIVLNALVRSIGGSPATSVREQTQAIVVALQSAGVPEFDLEARRLLGKQAVYVPDDSGKVLDEMLARNAESHAKPMRANQAWGQAGQSIPATKDLYAKAAAELNKTLIEKRDIGFDRVFVPTPKGYY